MKVIGYARTSTEGQGIGLDKQEDEIREYCEEQSYNLQSLFSEKVSGRTQLIHMMSPQTPYIEFGSRDQLHEVFLEVVDSDIDKVIVFNPSRLARISHYQGMLEEVFEKAGAEVEYVQSSEKWIVRKILAIFDEYEVRQTIKRTVDALAQKKENDEWVGRPPTGYVVDDNKLIPSKNHQALEKAEEIYQRDEDIGYKTARDKAMEELEYPTDEISKSQVRSFINRDREKIRRFLKES